MGETDGQSFKPVISHSSYSLPDVSPTHKTPNHKYPHPIYLFDQFGTDAGKVFELTLGRAFANEIGPESVDVGACSLDVRSIYPGGGGNICRGILAIEEALNCSRDPQQGCSWYVKKREGQI